jgi:acyl-CoA thioesterase
MWADDHASRSCGMAIAAVGVGSAVLTMTVRDDMVNGLGLCHGGMIFMLADSAMAFASNAANVVSVAAGASIEFLAPARLGDLLTATATERTRGARTCLHDVEVRSADGTLVAVFHGRTASLGRPVVAERGAAVPAPSS